MIKKTVVILVGISLLASSWAVDKNISVRTEIFENAIIKTVFEFNIQNENKSIISMSIDPDDIVYEGIDKSFTVMDLAEYEESGQKYYISATAAGRIIRLKTEIELLNQRNIGWGYVGKKFIYSGNNRSASIYVKGSYNGMLETLEEVGGVLGSVYYGVSIVVSVYDMDTGARIVLREVYEDENSGMWKRRYANYSNCYESMSVYLQDGYVYKILLEASVEAQGVVNEISRVDFYNSINDRDIRMVECGVEF